MEQVIDILLDAGLEILTLIVGGIVAKIGLEFQKWMKAKGNVESLQSKEKYAMLAVYAVEMAFQDVNGADKYEAAKNKLLDFCKRYNIPLDEREIDTLIESSVLVLRNEAEEIKKLYKTELEKMEGI